jgi:hypothetical protein
MKSATGHAVRSVLILRSAAGASRRMGTAHDREASSFETPATQVGCCRLAREIMPMSGKPDIGGGLLRMRIGGVF